MGKARAIVQLLKDLESITSIHHSSSQMTINPVPGKLISFSAHGVPTYTHIHTIKIKEKNRDRLATWFNEEGFLLTDGLSSTPKTTWWKEETIPKLSYEIHMYTMASLYSPPTQNK